MSEVGIGGLAMEDRSGGYSGRQTSFKINNDLVQHLKAEGVSMQFIGRDLMRALTNNIVAMTAFKSRKKAVDEVDKDLGKVFAVLDNPDVIKYFDGEFGDGATTKGGKVKGKKRQRQVKERLPDVVFNWQGDQGRMNGWHQKFRKNGIVRKRPRTITTKRGIEFGDEMYVPRTAYNRYRRTVLTSIAKLKAGWRPASDYWAARTQGRQVMPAFVKKQTIASGAFSDKFKANGEGYGTSVNLVPYADKMTHYLLDIAEAKAERYIEKATKQQAEKIVARFNAGKK